MGEREKGDQCWMLEGGFRGVWRGGLVGVGGVLVGWGGVVVFVSRLLVLVVVVVVCVCCLWLLLFFFKKSV